MKYRSIAILGAGSWGTALANRWANDQRDVRLWARKKSLAEQLQTTRENSAYLPGITLPKSITITSELKDAAAVDLVVFVTPSTALRKIAQDLSTVGIQKNAILISCTKGIEHGTGKRMTEIMHEYFPDNRLAVLSGPNIASEIARDLPAAAVLACSDNAAAAQLQEDLGSPRFRVYTSDDLVGVELGGALKNVVAISAGICEGLALGDNAKAALITRAVPEMVRLGTAMGGKVPTFYGLGGVGDLIVTCYSRHSRNRTLGERLGRGETLEGITSSMQMVAEGIPTAQSAHEVARKLEIETPIIDQVYAILYRNKPLRQAMEELLGREQKPERI